MSPSTTVEEPTTEAPVDATAVAATPGPPPSRVSRNENRTKYLKYGAIALGVVLVLRFLMIHWDTLLRVDAPFTLRTDDRVGMVSPDTDEVIEELPMTVTWELQEGFELEPGMRFAVFVDTGFPSPNSDVRVRVCSVQGQLPPNPGELRAPCKDQRERVYFTTKTSMSFDCFEPRFSAGRRRQNDHSVSVVLVDVNNKRVGETAAAVSFTVDSDAAAACRGF